jgi:hypothetical protein
MENTTTYTFVRGTYGINNHDCYWIHYDGQDLNKFVLESDLLVIIQQYLDKGFSILIKK